jgi:hypothetical protein
MEWKSTNDSSQQRDQRASAARKQLCENSFEKFPAA